MYRVVKRDGRIVDFEISKIANAMKKAFDATETNYNQSVIDFLARSWSRRISSRRSTDELSLTSRISRTAWRTCSAAAGYEDVAKAYILYRKQREKLRNMSSTYARL